MNFLQVLEIFFYSCQEIWSFKVIIDQMVVAYNSRRNSDIYETFLAMKIR